GAADHQRVLGGRRVSGQQEEVAGHLVGSRGVRSRGVEELRSSHRYSSTPRLLTPLLPTRCPAAPPRPPPRRATSTPATPAAPPTPRWNSAGATACPNTCAPATTPSAP